MPLDKKILSIDFDDDDKDYLSFSEYLNEDLERNKNKTANEFNQIADDLLAEIEEKKKIIEIEKDKLITFILKHSKNKYSSYQLKSYSISDVRNIHNEIKNNRNVLSKFFHFMFNLQ